MQSRATAMGKLQQVGGHSPVCTTSSHTRAPVSAAPPTRLIVHMSLSRALPS